MMNEITWKTDGSGRVAGPGIHDSKLVEFSFSENGTIRIRLQLVSSNVIGVELSNVKDMSVTDLLIGPIVSDIYVWRVDSVPEKSWGIPDSAWNVLFSKRMTSADAKKAAEKIVKNNPASLLVQIECSYGGAIAAVCDKVSIYQN